jgi:hypothetical protein
MYMHTYPQSPSVKGELRIAFKRGPFLDACSFAPSLGSPEGWHIKLVCRNHIYMLLRGCSARNNI